MKKIERSEYKINGASNSGYIIAKESDLDELEQQRDELIDALYEYAGVCVPGCGYTLLDVYDPSSTGCITCRQADRACKFLREEIKAGKHE